MPLTHKYGPFHSLYSFQLTHCVNKDQDLDHQRDQEEQVIGNWDAEFFKVL